MMEDMNNSKIWEETFVKKEWGKYPSIPLVKFIASNFYEVADRSHIRILEIGCGTGANIWFMAKEGFQVYGIDFSQTALNRLKTRLKNEDLEGQLGGLLVGDYLDKLNEFPNEYFDAIIDIESLYCNSFEVSQRIMELCVSKLKKGGLMFSQTFNEKTWGFDLNEVSYHFVRPNEGPLKNSGLARYTTREDINTLYKFDNSEIRNIELQELHLMNGKSIGEWLITIAKN